MNERPRKQTLRIEFDDDGNPIKMKYCRCSWCAHCQGTCDKLIAIYPGEDPEEAGEAISAGKFNALRFCPECREARRAFNKAEWAHIHRKLDHERHKKVREQARTATAAAERMQEALQTADQAIANYRAEIRRMGGNPDAVRQEYQRGVKAEEQSGGIRGFIKRIVEGDG